MAASVSSYTPITHPWFVKPSMKRKLPSSSPSSDSSPSVTPPSHSDSDSVPFINPHKPKRRRFSVLEKGFSHLSLEQQHNVGGFMEVSPVSPDARLLPSQLPDISEMSPSAYHPWEPEMGDEMQYENLNVVKPAEVEEPYEHPPTPPIHEINMKSSSWYEPEPDRIVVTDLDDSEDEADVEDNPISLPASILKHIAARNMGVLSETSGRPPFLGEDLNRALVLFRPLPMVSSVGEEDDDSVEESSSAFRSDAVIDTPLSGIPDDDDAMDVDSSSSFS